MNKANTQPGTGAMALIKLLRDGLLTLPAATRRELRLKEGDYLEAEVVNGEVRLKPVTVVDRNQAWKRIMAIVEEDKWKGPEPRPSPEEEEQWIFDVLAEEPDRHA
jgi:AbrB family looped-hinge helix DNA binding protein